MRKSTYQISFRCDLLTYDRWLAHVRAQRTVDDPLRSQWRILNDLLEEHYRVHGRLLEPTRKPDLNAPH